MRPFLQDKDIYWCAEGHGLPPYLYGLGEMPGPMQQKLIDGWLVRHAGTQRGKPVYEVTRKVGAARFKYRGSTESAVTRYIARQNRIIKQWQFVRQEGPLSIFRTVSTPTRYWATKTLLPSLPADTASGKATELEAIDPQKALALRRQQDEIRNQAEIAAQRARDAERIAAEEAAAARRKHKLTTYRLFDVYVDLTSFPQSHVPSFAEANTTRYPFRLIHVTTGKQFMRTGTPAEVKQWADDILDEVPGANPGAGSSGLVPVTLDNGQTIMMNAAMVKVKAEQGVPMHMAPFAEEHVKRELAERGEELPPDITFDEPDFEFDVSAGKSRQPAAAGAGTGWKTLALVVAAGVGAALLMRST